MYHKTTPDQLDFIDFYLPFGGKMNKNNRWVKLAEIIPWETVEKHYREQLADTGMGAPAKSGRIAFGALVIKEKLGCTDEETVKRARILAPYDRISLARRCKDAGCPAELKPCTVKKFHCCRIQTTFRTFHGQKQIIRP